MPRLSRLVFALTAVVAVLFGADPAPGVSNSDGIAGNVVRLQGPAIAMQDANPRVLKRGDPIYIGDVLSTGASASPSAWEIESEA